MIEPNIFRGLSQRMDHIDPASIRLQGDRVLLEDLPEDERRGAIWFPQVCQNRELLRRAKVIAVGPGDAFLERVPDQYNVHSEGYVRVSRRAVQCGHLPMSVEPGDEVLYTRRAEAEVYINGTRYVMCHEEQAVLGIFKTFLGLRSDRFALSGSRMVALCPLRDRVLVSRDAAPQKTAGGLFIPAACSEERPEGVVIRVGPGRFARDGSRIPVEVKPGQRVRFEAGRGSDFEMRGERFLVMWESDILAVLEGQ